MTREGYKKHKEIFEAWVNGAEIEELHVDRWYDVVDPVWIKNAQYRIKQQEPQKKTIVLETWLYRNHCGKYYTSEAEIEWHGDGVGKVKLLSTREVEIDED